MLEYPLLALAGFVAWIVSTIGGGGGAMLLVPLTGFIVGAQAVAPVVTLATLIAGGGRGPGDEHPLPRGHLDSGR